MPKGTSIKDALKLWEEKTGQKASEAVEMILCFQYPPIVKMDNSLSALAKCEKLSLSTNCIDKIAGLNGLKRLKILALGRNQIKNFVGLEGIGDTLEQLWISYNNIEKMKGVNTLKALKVLLMSNNLVKDWKEFDLLKECSSLETLLFVGNPIYESMEEDAWRTEVARVLPKLKNLDGDTIIRQEE